MIAFGTAVTDLKAYDSYAAPGIALAAEPDSEVLVHQGTGSLFRNYNLIIDLARKHEQLEALALVHQDAEIVDRDFCSKVRKALEDPDVAIVGCAGALGVRGIAWWEGALTWASFTHRYEELGGGEFPAPAWDAEHVPSFAQTGEVDSIDGFIIVMSPWAIENLRFDESLGKLHGYDFDICMQARAAGKKVVTTDFRAIHHHSLTLISDPDSWIEAHIRIAEKWDGRLESSPELGDWRTRALRAEAEAAASKGQMVSANLRAEAIERQLRRVEDSASWKLTRPLRRLRLRMQQKRS
jgi:GT2 family glycosyltransferase